MRLQRYIRPMVKALRRSVIGNCTVHMVHNQLGKLKLLRGDIETDSGMAHTGLTVAESLGYIDHVFSEYKAEAGVDSFYGRAAEVGPGDNCGIGLALIGDGCDSVDLVDRFYSKRDDAHHQEIYRELIARSERLRTLMGKAIKEEDFPGIQRHYGKSASSEEFFVRNRGYDFIVSRAVLEHVYDPVLSLKRMAAALNPGGLMLHVVDLRDHGMFSDVGFPSTKFLEIPQWIYHEMTQAVGRPNRVPISAYRRAVADCGLNTTFKVTHLVGQEKLPRPTLYEEIDESTRRKAIEQIARVRPRLAKDLRNETDEDLSISGFFLIARKP